MAAPTINFTTTAIASTINATTLVTTLVPTTLMSTLAPMTMSLNDSSKDNVSSNATERPPKQGPTCLQRKDTQEELIIKITAYVLILIVSLFGNILIAAVILSNKKMKKPTNYFILNMAISDLVIPAMVISRQIVQLYRQNSPYEWLVEGAFGMVLCKIVFFLQDVSTAVSIFSLILITVDRYIAVVYPMKHYIMSNTVSKVSILMTWLVGMGLHSVYLYIYDVKLYRGTNVCYSFWSKFPDAKSVQRNYYLSMFFLLAVVPFVIMAAAYTVIIVSLKRQSMPLGDSISDRQKRQRAERESKVLRMAIAIIVSFAILWAPYNTIAFLNFFIYPIPGSAPCWMPLLTFISFYCAYANAAVNPCICFIFSQNFRQGFKQMLSSMGLLKTGMSLRQQNTQISMQNKAYEDDDKTVST